MRSSVGYALDAVLFCATLYLLASSPVVSDVRVAGVSALAKLADGPLVGNHSRLIALSNPTLQKWYNFVLDDNLGRYAATNSNLVRFHQNNAWLNELVLPSAVTQTLPHILAVWVRNCIAGWALYYAVGALWSVGIYWLWGSYFFPNAADKPSWEAIGTQMAVSTKAMVMYSFMPTLGEWFMERGWTLAYLDFPTGWDGAVRYIAGFAAYIFLVEWGIYWAHRGLHDHRGLYLLLHKPHHIYNNRNALSPFAGLAFHPVDGMIQASPYVFFLFVLPVHFWAHLGALFFTAIWTTNIHDTIKANSEPIMGAAYHTLHHTLYKDNYGQFFVFFDWVHDTLTVPGSRRAGDGIAPEPGAEKEADVSARSAVAKAKGTKAM